MTKYTKESLEKIVKESFSVSEVLRRLNIKFAGGSHAHIKKKINQFNIDTSHFLGRAINQGIHHKGGSLKKNAKDILVLRGDFYKEKSHLLRRAMLESGIAHKCQDCPNEGVWNGKFLTLQIDHINGNNKDNRIDNLRFLCPNCHSQTETFGFKKKC